MKRLAPYALAAAVAVLILAVWFAMDVWASGRCARVDARVKYIDRSWVCVTADGRIIEP